MGLLTTRIEGAGVSGTHRQRDSLESSPAVANPRGAIPNIRQPDFGSPTAVLLRRTEHARESGQTHKTDTFQQVIAAPARAGEPWHRLGSQNSTAGKKTMAGAATPPLLRIGVLALLVLQNTSLRLVMKHARTVSPNFSATAAVFACEILKFSVAIAVLARVRRSLTVALVEVLNYRELIPMLVPAALYLLADRLHHVSTRRLDVAAFQVLSQSKVLTAALFGKVFRGRDYSSRQWVCLCAIAGGIAICQLADIGVDTVPMPDLLGVATVMTTSLLGAAAGTYIEATLQRGSGDGVLWKRAAQMAANGCLIAAGPASRSNLDGFVFSAWMVVALNAAGGLLVAAAMRYADNVLKTLAASLSIVVSTVAATVFLSAPAPSSRFAFGGLIVVGSIYVYGTAPKVVVETRAEAAEKA